MNGTGYVAVLGRRRHRRLRRLLGLGLDQDEDPTASSSNSATPATTTANTQLGIGNGKVNFWDFGNNEYGFNITPPNRSPTIVGTTSTGCAKSNGPAKIYIDGTWTARQAGPAVALGSGFNVYIGADIRNLYYGLAPEYFNGLIDEVQIYNRALSAGDVQTGYVFAPGADRNDLQSLGRACDD